MAILNHRLRYTLFFFFNSLCFYQKQKSDKCGAESLYLSYHGSSKVRAHLWMFCTSTCKANNFFYAVNLSPCLKTSNWDSFAACLLRRTAASHCPHWELDRSFISHSWKTSLHVSGQRERGNKHCGAVSFLAPRSRVLQLQ